MIDDFTIRSILSMDDCIIRQYDEKYASSIKDIMLDVCISEYKAQLWPHTKETLCDWRDWILSQNFSYYKFYPTSLLLAFNEVGELMGFISLKKVDNSTAEIKKCFILKRFRHKGIGQRLFSEIYKEALRLSGVEKLQATVCVPFYEAVNFFEHCGFSVTYFDPVKLEYKFERCL